MRSPFFSRSAAGAVVIVTLALVGCSSSSDSAEPANPDELFELGPYEVGFRELDLTYTAAGDGGERVLRVRVWYPAAPDSGAPPARYAVAGIVDIPAEIALDAPPVTEDDNLPLVVHSHGNNGESLTAIDYAVLMASHGWIHVAPNHTGNTVLDGSAPLTRSALDRPNDITAVIDAFESGLSGDPLEGKAAASEVLMYGHSFGGYTSFALGGAPYEVDDALQGCEESTSESCEVINTPENEAAFREGFLDPRIVALVPQTPAIGALGSLSDLGIPVMLQSGRLDQTTPQEQDAAPAWAQLNGENDIWVEMPEGAHFSVVNLCYELPRMLIELVQPNAFQDGCGPDFIDAEEAVFVLRAYLLAFGRRHVLGETQWDEVLEGPPLGNEGDFVITLK